jgi:hypothetical protein
MDQCRAWKSENGRQYTPAVGRDDIRSLAPQSDRN